MDNCNERKTTTDCIKKITDKKRIIQMRTTKLLSTPGEKSCSINSHSILPS